MGIGPTALRLYEHLLSERHFRSGMSVCELGSQDFVPKKYGNWINRISDKGARGFYEHLGMVPYVCIDTNGERDALRLDLNTVTWTGDQFDVVTNHGTSEHIFNQWNCFRVINDLTKPGGLMIHIVPCKGYPRHGFFRYDSLFFEELARENKYKMLCCYEENDRVGTLIVVVMRKLNDILFATPMQTTYGVAVPA